MGLQAYKSYASKNLGTNILEVSLSGIDGARNHENWFDDYD